MTSQGHADTGMDCCDVNLVFQLTILSPLYLSMVQGRAKEVLGKKHCDNFSASSSFSSFLHVALSFTPMFKTLIIPMAYWMQYRFIHLFLGSYYPIIHINTPTRLACLLAKHLFATFSLCLFLFLIFQTPMSSFKSPSLIILLVTLSFGFPYFCIFSYYIHILSDITL